MRHRAADGSALTSWLYLPAPGPSPPPLVIKPYPGDVHPEPPRGRSPDLAGFMGDVRTLVGHGYAVLVPSLPRGPEPEGPMVGMAARLAAVEAAAQLVTYWGEGHAILSPGNVRDLYGRIFDFLDARFASVRN